jgi:acetate kinase
MPDECKYYAIPWEYAEKYHVQRYGAHGTSHRYVSERCAELMGKDPSELNIITCHLGNGSSISAVKGGKCYDTSMGLTPLEGLVMGTRSGSIDPAIVGFLCEQGEMSVEDVNTMLNKKSGLLGVSGLSSDDRDLKAAAAEGNEQCLIARNILAYQIKKYIGAFAAAMNGIDAIVFTGGIGENADDIRDKVCNEISYLGVEIDNEIGKTLVKGKEGELSTENSKVKVYVLPTNEELAIARDTKEIFDALNA